MRLVICALNCCPELLGIGPLVGQLGHWLVARGHQVQVVCAPPYYPDWRVHLGYRAWAYRREQLDGLKLHRCPLWVPRRPSGLKRVLHLASFGLSSAPVALGYGLLTRPDVVFVVEPTLTVAPAAWLAAWLGGAHAWLHIQDLEVDAAFDLGLLAGRRRRQVVLALERLLLRRFDRITTIGEGMRQRVMAKLNGAPVGLFPNWVDADAIHPLPGPSPLRRELGLAPETIVALYMGNMGEKQGLELIPEVAERLAGRQDLCFVLAGQGAARSRLEAAAAALANVRFLPVQPPERLNDLFNLADLHLLPQRRDAAELVLPSKLSGLQASGRPIVTTAEPATQLGQIVAECGLVVPPGDVGALAAAIRQLADDPALRQRLGAAGRAYALAHWHRETVLRQFEQDLLACARPRWPS